MDGKEPAAFMGACAFPGLNRQDLEAAEPDVVTTMELLPPFIRALCPPPPRQ